MTTSRGRWQLLALAACAAAAAAGLWHHLSLHPDCTDRLRDDAYYSLVFARNLAAGHGPTVSDGVDTSGVQWLWALLLALASWLGAGAALPQLAAWLGLACHLLAAASWVVAGRAQSWAVCLGLLWLGNPLLVQECQNGQETALACLLLVWLWLSRRRGALRFGTLAVLATLARTDLFAAVLLLSLQRHGRRWWRGLPVALLALAASTALALCCGGGWLQDSGPPMAWLFHAQFAATEPTLLDWLRRQWWYTRPVLLGGSWAQVSAPALGAAAFLIARPWLQRRLRIVPLLLVGAAALLGGSDLVTAAVAAVLLWRWPRSAPAPRRTALLALGLGLAGVLVLHWPLRWYPRQYYLAPLAVLAVAALWRLRRLPWLLLLAGVWQALAAAGPGGEDLRGQEPMQMAGRFVDRLLPERPRLGVFNSGLVTWYRGEASPARVVNLDGVVDHRALAALQRGGLLAWLDTLGVDLLLDKGVEFSRDVRVPHASGRWFAPGFDAAADLLQLARFEVVPDAAAAPDADAMLLCWRRARGAPPRLPTAPQLLGPRRGGGCYVLWPATAGAVLEVETADGGRSALRHASDGIVMVLAVPAHRLGTGRLFERGRPSPLLTIAGL